VFDPAVEPEGRNSAAAKTLNPSASAMVCPLRLLPRFAHSRSCFPVCSLAATVCLGSEEGRCCGPEILQTVHSLVRSDAWQERLRQLQRPHLW
jgi:hypothetical protein